MVQKKKYDCTDINPMPRLVKCSFNYENDDDLWPKEFSRSCGHLEVSI